MNQTRTFLLVAWLALAYLVWQAWEQDHAAPPVAAATTSASANAIPVAAASVPSPSSGVPAANAPPMAMRAETAAAVSAPSAPPVILGNDVLRLRLSPRGAGVVGADLLTYGQTGARNSPSIKLFDDEAADFFVAESGLASASGHAPNHETVYQTEGGGGEKMLAAGGESIAQSFLWTDPDGMQVRKTYTLKRGSYVVGVHEEIRNNGAVAWTGNDYRQLRRVPPIIAKSGGLTNPETYSFVGAAWYSPEDKYETRAFAKFDQALDKTVTGGWTAMVQHYFLAAWIPDPKEGATLSIMTGATNGGSVYRIIAKGPAMQIPAGGSRSIDARLYVGPKLQDALPAIAPGLELTVDYGWFKTLSQPLYWLLSKLHWLLGNWGWSIIALVLLIKLAMFKFSEAQYKSFAKLRAVQPRLEALKERYGDDKQQYQMAMLELYKKEKINPAGGCLPMLVQIPIFFALYRVLLESVELRHAPWVGWIHSLSDQDPYYVLPALNMLVMFVTQRMTPSPGIDPMQQRMMQIMPLVFGVMFAFFPAGLVLYWITNGALGLLQQWWLMRKHGRPGVPARA